MSKYIYDSVPRARFNRSKDPVHFRRKMSLNVGELVPFYCQEIYPGDTFKISADFLARTINPFVKVPMDNLFLTMNYFFVPNRLLWDNWTQFLGENKRGAWAQEEHLTIPQIDVSDVSNDLKWGKTMLNNLGVPYGTTGLVNALPIRAFNRIYDEWYRDQNSETPALLHTDNVTRTATVGEYTPGNIYGRCPIVNKFHDRFTSALPAPQKGEAPSLSFEFPAVDIPVVTRPNAVPHPGIEPLRFNSKDPSFSDLFLSRLRKRDCTVSYIVCY